MTGTSTTEETVTALANPIRALLENGCIVMAFRDRRCLMAAALGYLCF